MKPKSNKSTNTIKKKYCSLEFHFTMLQAEFFFLHSFIEIDRKNNWK